MNNPIRQFFLLLFLTGTFLWSSCVQDDNPCDRDNPDEIIVEPLKNANDSLFPYAPSWTSIEYLYTDDTIKQMLLNFELKQIDTIEHDYNSWDGGGLGCTSYYNEIARFYYVAYDSFKRKHEMMIKRNKGDIISIAVIIDKVEHYAVDQYSYLGYYLNSLNSNDDEFLKSATVNNEKYYNVFKTINSTHDIECIFSTQLGVLQVVDYKKNRTYSRIKR